PAGNIVPRGAEEKVVFELRAPAAITSPQSFRPAASRGTALARSPSAPCARDECSRNVVSDLVAIRPQSNHGGEYAQASDRRPAAGFRRRVRRGTAVLPGTALGGSGSSSHFIHGEGKRDLHLDRIRTHLPVAGDGTR